MSVMSAIKSPLAGVLILIITLSLAALTVAASVSGALTAAAVSAAGLFVVVLILGMIRFAGGT